MFAPGTSESDDVAGFGVVDPKGMLLTASLMLAEGLKRRSASRTLERAVGARSRAAASPHDTRSFTDAVIDLLPQTRTDVEHFDEVAVMRPHARLRRDPACPRAEGVDVAFGIPGGAILPTYDAIARGTTVRHVLARHEQGAGHMAEGYARASGKVGVAIATSGPGATNLVTPIADAWMDSTPLVAITGQVRSTLIGTDAFQEIDATGITMPIVKHSWLVQDVEELPGVLKAAFHVARTGRQGPVLVDIAKDVQEAEFDFVYPDEVDLPGWKPPHKVHPRQLREAAKAIAEAQRPIVYAGGGVLNADACAELLELVDSAQLPAVVTLMGKGCLPGLASAQLRRARHARLEVRELGAEQGRPRDRGRLALRRPRHRQGVGVRSGREGDPLRHRCGRGREDPPRGDPGRRAAEARAGAARRGGPRPLGRRRGSRYAGRGCVSSRIGVSGFRTATRRRTASSSRRPPSRRCATSRRRARRTSIWTTGVGQHQMWAMQYIQCEKPRTFVTSGGLGTMGYGLPAAVGAKAARPDATVVCIDGDGCFQMTCQELATAALERLPIVAVVINNGWLGMVRQWQEMFYAERFAQTHLTHSVPDYAQLAEAYGCAGFTVESEDQLEDALAAAFDAGRSAVVDVRCDPEEKCFPMIPAGAAAVDIIEAPGEEVVPA